MPETRDDPVLRHSRREAWMIAAAWLAATAATCLLSSALGYSRPGRPLGPDDVRPILGIPLWFFLGVLGPWAACVAWTWWFVLNRMSEDELGPDHAAELEGDIREEAHLDG